MQANKQHSQKQPKQKFSPVCLMAVTCLILQLFLINPDVRALQFKKKKANTSLLSGTERSHQQSQDPAGEAQEVLSVQLPLGCQGRCVCVGDGCPRMSQNTADISLSGTQ